MHVDNYDSSTFKWILEELDVPYVPKEWDKLLAKYATETTRMSGLTIIGRYLGIMKLNQYKNCRWADTERLQQIADKQLKEAMEAQGCAASEIQEEVLNNADLRSQAPPTADPAPNLTLTQTDVAVDFDSQLTAEDKTYLAVKWGSLYRANEWVQLEEFFKEMMMSYDIQSAGDVNTLKLACKCSLKANQLLDMGDIEGAQKATKMYETLMKSGKWTAAQIKENENSEIDSIGEIAEICEQQGFIPVYYVSKPQDHVDRVIQDLQKYTSDLIANENGLSTIIERAVNQLVEERQNKSKGAEETQDEDAMFDYQSDILSGGTETFTEYEQSLLDENEELFEGYVGE